MVSLLSIAEVAQRTGLTAHTLRYYERAGLIASVARAPGGQRRYAASDLEWIGFLLRLRETRMSIGQMLVFARLRDQGDATVPERRRLLQAHLVDVLASIDAMRRSAEVLRRKIDHYRAIEAPPQATPTATHHQEPSHGPQTTIPKKRADSGPLPPRPRQTAGNRR